MKIPIEFSRRIWKINFEPKNKLNKLKQGKEREREKKSNTPYLEIQSVKGTP